MTVKVESVLSLPSHPNLNSIEIRGKREKSPLALLCKTYRYLHTLFSIQFESYSTLTLLKSSLRFFIRAQVGWSWETYSFSVSVGKESICFRDNWSCSKELLNINCFVCFKLPCLTIILKMGHDTINMCECSINYFCM